MIKRVELSAALQAQLAQVEKQHVPRLYAELGLWYDAIATVSNLIDMTPEEPAFRKQRAALLGQVGLVNIDKYDLHDRK